MPYVRETSPQFVALAAIILTLTGCDQLNLPASQSAQPQPAPSPRPVHTFKPLPSTDGDLALDETTGQKCRTWNWQCGCYSQAKERAEQFLAPDPPQQQEQFLPPDSPAGQAQASSAQTDQRDPNLDWSTFQPLPDAASSRKQPAAQPFKKQVAAGGGAIVPPQVLKAGGAVGGSIFNEDPKGL